MTASITAFKARLAFRSIKVVRQRNPDLWRPTRRRLGLRQPVLEALVDKALQQTDIANVLRGTQRTEPSGKSS